MKLIAVLGIALTAAAADPPMPGELVDVGGRRLHLFCQGSGEPVVLLLSGLPRYSIHWALVQPEVAKFARVCAYDRAGDAWSDPWPPEYSLETMVSDLEAIMGRVSPSRPLVLAGHSFGGVLAREEWRRRKDRVAAMVLIDSPHHNWMNVRVGGARRRMSELTRSEAMSVAEESKARFMPPKPDPQIVPPFDKLPEAARPLHLWAFGKMIAQTKADDVFLAVMTQWTLYSGLREVKFGDTPLVAVSRPSPEPWVQSQKDIAALSTKGEFFVAEGSEHDIELDKPQVVIDAIRSAWTKVAAPPAK